MKPLYVSTVFLFISILFLFISNPVAAATINRPPSYLSSNNGLVGYWTMDGSKVNWKTGAVTDSSEWGNTGFVTNMATSTGVAIGRIGQALNFDGVNDYVTISDNSSLDIINNITLSAWIKLSTIKTGASQWQYIIHKRDPTGGTETNYDFRIASNSWTSGNNELGFSVYNGGWGIYETSNADFAINTWYYVVVTYDNNTAKFYKNGILLTSSLVFGTGGLDMLANGRAIEIGDLSGWTPSADANFSGLIDDVRIYNRALSAKEVAILYNSGAAKFNVSPTKYLTDGLVGYWTMDSKDINWKTGTVKDLSPFGNNGTVTSTATSSMATTTAPRAGKIGQALSFNGSNDYIRVGTPASLNITGPLTISAWIYPRSFGANDRGRLVDKENDFVSGYAFSVFDPSTNNPDRSFALFINASGGNLNCVASNSSITLNRWQQIAVTLDSSKFCIPYLNGAKATTSAGMIMGSFPGSGSNSFTIGNNSGNTRDFDGLIDEVRVYNRALSKNEIATLYNSGAAKFNVSPTKYLTDGLVGYWTMDGSKVNWKTGSVTDSSGRGNTGTITNMATSTGVGTGKIGQALNFDGVDDYLNTGSDSIDKGAVSVSVWIYAHSFGGASLGRIIDNGKTIFLVLGTGGNAPSLRFSSDGATNVDSAVNSIKLNTWYHAVVARDSSGVTNFYINGIQSGTADQSSGTPASGTTNVNIGGRSTDNLRNFDGLIDEVRVYNRVLSAQEIKQLYNAGR